MAEIRVQEGEPLENALRRFKRKVQTEDIIKEVKRHSFYLKPGEKKRVKEALARKRNRKKVHVEQDYLTLRGVEFCRKDGRRGAKLVSGGRWKYATGGECCTVAFSPRRV